MRFFTLLLFLCCCTKCPKVDEGFEAIEEYSKRLQQEKNWEHIAIGGSFFDDNFKLITSYVISGEKYTVPEARKLLIQTVEDFLVYLNQNEKIRPYISHYPMTYKDIDLSLSFQDAQEGYVTYASLFGGMLNFHSDTARLDSQFYNESEQQAYEAELHQYYQEHGLPVKKR